MKSEYFSKTQRGKVWVGYSRTRNKEQERKVEKAINQAMRENKFMMYKKEQNKKVVKMWGVE